MHGPGCGAAAGRRCSGEAVRRHPGCDFLVRWLGGGEVAALWSGGRVVVALQVRRWGSSGVVALSVAVWLVRASDDDTQGNSELSHVSCCV